jgi:signal transduction histidine kinase
MAMRVSLDQKIRLGLGMALLILCIVGVIAYRTTAGLVETADLVARSHEVLAALEDLQSMLHQGEAADAIRPRLDHLRALTADTRVYRGQLEAVELLLEERRSPQQLDALRRALTTLEHEEDQALRQQTAASKASARRATLAIACGSLLGFVLTGLASWIIGRDINARNRAEEALQRAKETAEATTRAKSQLLANMSHELRTPLNSVIGFANVLLKNRGHNLGEQELTYVRRIVDNGKHLLALINQVLDLSRVEAGRMEVRLAPVALDALLRETLGELEGQARDKGLRLEAEMSEALAPFETDAGKLKQIIINLIGNAIKFTEKGGVTVHLTALGGRPASIAVSDTGIGIPADQRELIFEAFRQLDTGPSRRYEGSGLGLAISRSLCQLLGYRLLVESTVGQGTTFRVVLAGEGREQGPCTT